MNRVLRNLAAFAVGVLLVGLPMLAFAETIAATGTGVPTHAIGWASIENLPGTVHTQDGVKYNTAVEACQAVVSVNPCEAADCFSGSGRCKINAAYKIIGYSTATGCTSAETLSNGQCWTYSCPSTGGWTKDGLTCTRPDCVAPQVRDEITGACGAPPCTAGQTSTAAWYSGKSDIGGHLIGTLNTFPATLCDGSCSGVPTAGASGMLQTCPGSATATPAIPFPVLCTVGITLTGTQCSGFNNSAPATLTVPTSDPPCTAGQGVIEVGGKVTCVDANQVPTSDPNKVNKSTSTQTNPDGSQTITTTVQTCTGAGACSTTTTTTITAATGGAAGTAGTPGTTTKTDAKPSDSQAKFCAENPGLQICKGGMATEALQKDTLDELKKLTTPTVSDASAIEGQTFDTTTGRQDLTDKDNELKNYANGSVVDAGVSSSKSAWEGAMLSGWWEPIDLGGCTPFVMTFSGRSVTIDHCEKAALISQIGAYAMWIVLAIGTFVMLTGGRNT